MMVVHRRPVRRWFSFFRLLSLVNLVQKLGKEPYLPAYRTQITYTHLPSKMTKLLNECSNTLRKFTHITLKSYVECQWIFPFDVILQHSPSEF